MISSLNNRVYSRFRICQSSMEVLDIWASGEGFCKVYYILICTTGFSLTVVTLKKTTDNSKFYSTVSNHAIFRLPLDIDRCEWDVYLFTLLMKLNTILYAFSIERLNKYLGIPYMNEEILIIYFRMKINLPQGWSLKLEP